MSKLTSEQVMTVIDSLVGDVMPVAESHADSKRFANLTNYCHLFMQMSEVIQSVANEHEDPHASVQKAGKHARLVIKETHFEFCEALGLETPE